VKQANRSYKAQALEVGSEFCQKEDSSALPAILVQRLQPRLV
jgi:hypothetical protein